MLFIISFSLGIIILLISLAFLGAVFYHLLQYQMPNQNYRKPVAIIFVLSIFFLFVGYWIFSNIPWEVL